jgi:hypothetical protein
MVKIKNKKITLPKQLLAIKSLKTTQSVNFINHGIVALFEIQPTYSSDKYTVKMIYESLEKRPRFYLLNHLPKEKTVIPHTYGLKRIDGKLYPQLCLNLIEDWNGAMKICDTLYPWLVEWLYFYEVWLITNKWLGGGHVFRKSEYKDDSGRNNNVKSKN